jgi:opacity protein-like surface antigen
MATMPKIRLLTPGLLCVLSLAARPAAADVLLTPFAGVAFADESDRNGNYGASLAFGGLIGLELDISQTKIGSFDDIPFVSLSADATTVMGNLMVRIPAGPIQPYGSGGLGLIRLSGSVGVPIFGTEFSADAQDLGMNVGGGVHIFPSRNLGIRGDVRYFRTLGDLTLDELTDLDDLDDLPLPRLDFWRITGGVTIRF